MSADDPGQRRSEWGWRGGESRFSGRVTDPRLERALRRLERLSAAQAAGEPPLPAPGVRISQQGPPASADRIVEAELRVGTALPNDYSRFLLRWDGMTLSLPHAAGRRQPGELSLLGTDYLIRHADDLAGQYSTACIPELLLFATIGTEGDRLAFATGRLNPLGGCAVLEARRNRHPESWWVIAPDFAGWLDDLLRPGRAGSAVGRDWSDGRGLLQPPLPFDEADDLEPVEI